MSEGILIAKLDGFARSVTGALETIKRLDEAGATFVWVAERLDPTTLAGKMLIRPELELDRMRKTQNQSRRRAVARGVHLGCVPPGLQARSGWAARPQQGQGAAAGGGIPRRAECRTWIPCRRPPSRRLLLPTCTQVHLARRHRSHRCRARPTADRISDSSRLGSNVR